MPPTEIQSVNLYTRLNEPAFFGLTSRGGGSQFQYGSTKILTAPTEGTVLMGEQTVATSGFKAVSFTESGRFSITSEIPISQPKPLTAPKFEFAKLPKGERTPLSFTGEKPTAKPSTSPISEQPSVKQSPTKGGQLEVQYDITKYDKPISISELQSAIPKEQMKVASLQELKFRAFELNGQKLSQDYIAASLQMSKPQQYQQYNLKEVSQTRFVELQQTQKTKELMFPPLTIEKTLTFPPQTKTTTYPPLTLEKTTTYPPLTIERTMPPMTIEITMPPQTIEQQLTYPPQTPPPTFTTGTPPPPTGFTPLPPPTVPLMFGGFGDLGGFEPAKKSKGQKGKYQPSLTAAIFNIRGAKGKTEQTGFGLRPLPSASKKEKEPKGLRLSKSDVKKLGGKF
jgi:hypothetical protein